jgi:spore maturation protein CgeB
VPEQKVEAMKILVIGKTGSVTHWLEDCSAGLLAAGHNARTYPTRNPRVSIAIEKLLFSPALGAPLAVRIVRAARQFRPDLILAVKGFDMPPAVLSRLRSLPDRPPLVAWVGDVFVETDRSIAAHYDMVAYTDSFFVQRHHAMGFASRCMYLPHAASPHLGQPDATPRMPRLVFVANPTPHRVDLLDRVRTPIELYGPGWRAFSQARHAIHVGRLDTAGLANAYRSHIGVLNIRHEANVVYGLNQRSFDPYVLGTPVISDAQPDLENCFEAGREVLVYRDADELEDICRRLEREPKIAAEIGAAGRRRVMSQHCYQHRLDNILAALA